MALVEDALNEFGREVVKLAKINIGATRTVNGKRRRIDSSGKLRKSINYSLKTHKNSFSFFIEMEDYGEWVDKGRKPGKGIPKDALFKWIKTKPIRVRDLKTNSFVKQTESRIKSLAFLINRKIKEEGIAATNFLKEPFDKKFKDLPNELLEAYALDLEKFLENSLDNLNKDYK